MTGLRWVAVLNDQVAGVAGEGGSPRSRRRAPEPTSTIFAVWEKWSSAAWPDWRQASIAFSMTRLNLSQAAYSSKELQIARAPVFVRLGVELADALEGPVMLLDDALACHFPLPMLPRDAGCFYLSGYSGALNRQGSLDSCRCALPGSSCSQLLQVRIIRARTSGELALQSARSPSAPRRCRSPPPPRTCPRNGGC